MSAQMQVAVAPADHHVAAMAEAAPQATTWIAPETLRRLTRIDVTASVQHIAGEWLGIVAAASVCEAFFSWWGYALAVLWIGARLHALGILAHDGAHGLLAKKRTHNDWLVELTLAWPVMLSLDAYRALHVQHHRALNTDDDPDWARNRPSRLSTCDSRLAFVLILLGVNREQLRMLRFVLPRRPQSSADRSQTQPQKPRAENAASRVRAWIYALLLVVAVLGGWRWLLMYWLIPFATWFMVSMRIKGISEHFAVDDTEPCRAARTITPAWWVRWFLAPKGVHYHIEHHLFPSVPCFRLQELHAVLMASAYYRSHAHVTPSYLAFFRECWRSTRVAQTAKAR